MERTVKLPEDLVVAEGLKITVSVGCYFTRNIKNRDFDEIFNEADKDLYNFKTGTRGNYKLIIDENYKTI